MTLKLVDDLNDLAEDLEKIFAWLDARPKHEFAIIMSRMARVRNQIEDSEAAFQVKGIHRLYADLAQKAAKELGEGKVYDVNAQDYVAGEMRDDLRENVASGRIPAGTPVIVEDGKVYNRADYLEEKLNQAIDLMVDYAYRGAPVLLRIRNWLQRRCKHHPAVKSLEGCEPKQTAEGKALAEANDIARTALDERVKWYDKAEALEANIKAIEGANQRLADKVDGLEADLDSALEVMVRHAFWGRPSYKLREWLEANYRNHRAMLERGKGKHDAHGYHVPRLTALLNAERIAGMREAMSVISPDKPHGKTQQMCIDLLAVRIKELENLPHG